ncbi:hypothetical protein [Chlorobaculum thiosulfatiphilum]|uniref:hypothetical protein n=1 Tax=Chlorobaculum thiosulfatiphilum TaxID=115852 RepID=UPI001476DD27|nr:hypothetical protein [Chlorobaculum thiosulfatiphilum]
MNKAVREVVISLKFSASSFPECANKKEDILSIFVELTARKAAYRKHSLTKDHQPS